MNLLRLALTVLASIALAGCALPAALVPTPTPAAILGVPVATPVARLLAATPTPTAASVAISVPVATPTSAESAAPAATPAWPAPATSATPAGATPGPVGTTPEQPLAAAAATPTPMSEPRGVARRRPESGGRGADGPAAFWNLLNAAAPAPIGAETAKVPVLMYHYIRVNPDPKDTMGQDLSVPPRAFAEQMRYLAENDFTVITLGELQRRRAAGESFEVRTVALTFDDGYLDFYTAAWPILRAYGFPASVYVITDLIDERGYLTWSQIEELARLGVEIGSHTITHPLLPRLPLPALHRELQISKVRLERRLRTDVETLAYPAGHHDRTVVSMARSIGYRAGVTTRQGFAKSSDDPLMLPRVRIWGGIALAHFAALIQSDRWIEALEATPTATPFPMPTRRAR